MYKLIVFPGSSDPDTIVEPSQQMQESSIGPLRKIILSFSNLENMSKYLSPWM